MKKPTVKHKAKGGTTTKLLVAVTGRASAALTCAFSRPGAAFGMLPAVLSPIPRYLSPLLITAARGHAGNHS